MRRTAGGLPAHGIARWKPALQQWEALGSGMNGTVFSLAVDGRLVYAGGGFITPSRAANVAVWNGFGWFPLGKGTDNLVLSLAVSDGKLYAGGAFNTAGEIISQHLARRTPYPFYDAYLPLAMR